MGIKLTKQDYMRLSKERLAELLVEMDSHPIEPIQVPVMPTTPSGLVCDGIHCTNPHRDCINCPQIMHYGEFKTSPNTATGISTLKADGK